MLIPSPSALVVAVCVSDVSLAGENVNELDAYAARSRDAVSGEARIAIERGYGEAEHRSPSMPGPVRGRKSEVFPLWHPVSLSGIDRRVGGV